MCSQDGNSTGQAFFPERELLNALGGQRRVGLGWVEVLCQEEELLLPWVGGFFSLQEGTRTEDTGAGVGKLGSCPSHLC